MTRSHTFAHLRLHTEFSVVDGAVRVPDAIKAAVQHDQPALAITDLNNLFGAVKFYKKARGAGVKPLIGADITVTGIPNDGEATSPMPGQMPVLSRLLVLVQNDQGYLNLCELLARAWTRGTGKDQASVQWGWLQELNEGLIVLSGAQAGPVGRALMAGDTARASQLALSLAETFTHRFYLEIQRADREDDERHVMACVPLAARLGLPVVATHPIQFLAPDDYESHEARVCIAEGEMLANRRRVAKEDRQH